jgi:hypothetical protein
MFMHIYTFMFFHYAYLLLFFNEILNMYKDVIHIFYELVLRSRNAHVYAYPCVRFRISKVFKKKFNGLSITSNLCQRGFWHTQAPKCWSTQMHKVFFGQDMIMFVVGQRLETLLNIWMLAYWMFKVTLLQVKISFVVAHWRFVVTRENKHCC